MLDKTRFLRIYTFMYSKYRINIFMVHQGCRLVLVLNTAVQWKIGYDLSKSVLCDDRSPLNKLKVREWKFRYSPDKFKKRVVRIPTGKEALSIIYKKQRREKRQRSSTNQQAPGGRKNNAGDYVAIPGTRIYSRISINH